jgi:hypothetical protein
MEESALRYRTACPEAMRGQLRHLLAVMPLASMSLGIIPFTARRTVWEGVPMSAPTPAGTAPDRL